MKSLPVLAVLAVVLGLAAYAQTGPMGAAHGNHAASPGAAAGDAAGKPAPETPATAAYRDANAAMHEGMNIDFTGNADADFMRAMIPHHQGAVAMARVALEHGTDPEVRKLAEAVIATQGAEIKLMTDWLTARGYAIPPGIVTNEAPAPGPVSDTPSDPSGDQALGQSAGHAAGHAAGSSP